MLAERWGSHNSCCSNSHSRNNDNKDDNQKKDDIFNTGNNSKKKIGNGIRGGDTVTFVNADDSFVFVFPFLNGNTIAPIIDLLSNPQILLGAITGLNDADPKVDIDIL